MGMGYNIECTHCDYESFFSLGVGMRCPSIENLMDMVPEEEKKKIQEILEEYPMAFCNYRSVLCRCPACNDLSDQLYYKIHYPFEHLESEFSCSRCGKKLEILIDGDREYEADDEQEDDDDLELEETIQETPEQILSHTPCPTCGQTTLRIGEMMCWD